ncbi:MAG: diguanylate cyclase [Terriglobales bacterium]
MGTEAAGFHIPRQTVVEVGSEPTPELFSHNTPALTSLLRMALLSAVELTLPTALHLLLDVSHTVVESDRQLVVFHDPSNSVNRLQMGRNFEPLQPPDPAYNLLHAWVGRTGKPIIVTSGLEPAVDEYLHRFQATTAFASPLYVEHDWAGSIQLFRNDGPYFSSADGRLLWILSLLAENQMARINIMQNLMRMAYTDYLTGLRARGYFEQALEQEVRRALRKSGTCGLLLVDLDDFKAINDRYGHRAGDEVLRQFAQILAHDMRDVDTVARHGGDEFSAILPDVNEEGARFVANRLGDAVRRHAFRVPDLEPEIHLSASIGVALCPADERTPDQLMRAADLALYQAKLHGKNRPFFWHELRRAS